MKSYSALLVVAPVLLLAGCGGGDSSTQTSNVSFAVSDAPVDNASEVMIGFTEIELVKENGESIIIPVNTENNDYQQINLLDYQGTDSALLVSDEPIEVGTYKNLILHISDESGVNYVVIDDETGQQDLKQPSNKLKLGGFEVTGDEATQRFTIEFDLRQSLVMRGNSDSDNGYILKPHGVTILSSEATSLYGNVDPNLFYADDSCSADSGSNFVYLYQGHVADENLIDLVDKDDSEFDDSELPVPENAKIPYATAKVAVNGDYSFGYLPIDDYTVAFTCNGATDDSINYDGLTIPSPPGQVAEVTLVSGQTTSLDFDPI